MHCIFMAMIIYSLFFFIPAMQYAESAAADKHGRGRGTVFIFVFLDAT